MRILMVNKFLHPQGGSETYTFRLGEYLQKRGHEVQYFGMEHKGRCVGNRMGAYTEDMDFHGGFTFSKLTYPFKIIYSSGARRKIRFILNDFRPDVCHMNNFNYQLTPSVLLEIVKWRKEEGRRCRIIYTAHDYQLVCPNHLMYNPCTHELCERCLGGHFQNCIRGRCIHGSLIKSMIGTAEAAFWKWKRVYQYLDQIICCSEFLKSKLDSDPILAGKTKTLHNFIEQPGSEKEMKEEIKKDYVLYFGRLTQEKGIKTLIEACRMLPDIPFVFAGLGPLEKSMEKTANIREVGFQTGEALEKLIRGARITVCPSEWYENCPFSVLESQMYGTPVLGADIGGIPELIDEGITGELFESGNVYDLKEKIRKLWDHKELTEKYSENCKYRRLSILSDEVRMSHRDEGMHFGYTIEEYYEKLMEIYSEGMSEFVQKGG